MTGNDALMAKVRTVAKVLRAKADLQRPMPALQRLQTVARINRLRHELNPGRPAITSSPSMTINREHKA